MLHFIVSSVPDPVPMMLKKLTTLLAVSPAVQSFDIYEHLGNLSPYFTPSNTPASLQNGVPASCVVDRAFLVHRHGSRQPISGELPVIQNLSYYINNHSSLFSNPQAKLPADLAFLQDGWTSHFFLNNLTAVGRQQLFDHGVAFRLAYPDLYTNAVLAGDQDRVVESAQWFMDGFYGRSAHAEAHLTTIAEDNTTVSWITPMDTCDAWDYSSGNDLVSTWGAVYLPPIAARLNALLARAYPGIRFTPEHAHGMLWACAYGTAAAGRGRSPWCAVFSAREILDFEYELDLLMRGAFGYGLPRGQGRVLGSLLVQNVTAFLLDEARPAGSSANLSLNFAHDTTIDLGLTALGLAHDDGYPVSGPPAPARAWRTSAQVPFAAQMVWKRLSCADASSRHECRVDGGESCGETKKTARIQLELNGANFDLGPVGCKADRHGTCSLQDFMTTAKVSWARGIRHGDETWNEACSL